MLLEEPTTLYAFGGDADDEDEDEEEGEAEEGGETEAE